ncbi:MAG: hypothetical protein ABSC94_25820 [Polyangiaceae bacterium]
MPPTGPQAFALLIVSLAGCANTTAPATFADTSSRTSQGSGNGTQGSGGFGGVGASQGSLANGSLANGSLSASSSSSDVVYEAACPAGLQCSVSCSGGADTTISGKVYDPAGRNPLYNVAVYVPATPLQPLPSGVPTGAAECSCPALYPSGSVAGTTTAVDGTFTLTNAPAGASVPLVLQVGKWRRVVKINVSACQANPQPDGTLTLPGTIAAGDTDDNMPDIAVSTGHADQLECLLLRVGVAASEYVAGASTAGHVHIFSGGDPKGGSGGQTTPGGPESPTLAGAPASYTDLWANQAQLMPYDVTLLSCEGGETYDANPPALEAYLNAGGRVFASHFHYSWFSGPFASQQAYSAPADWGSHIATWTNPNPPGKGPIGGIIQTTLNGSSLPFPKGLAFQQWLTGVGALGQNGVPAGELSIYTPRYNAVVAAANTPSQAWIASDSSGMAGQTMYFSFDTPVGGTAPTGGDGGEPTYCGRVVFSDLHVSGDPATNDNSPPPDGCDPTTLSPQEKALEFMLFDLSSCVIPDSIQPPATVPPPPR